MKKLLIRLGIIAVIVLGIRDIYVRYHNLEYYSVYYATNLPHKEGTNPVLVMVMEKFDKIKLPEGYTVYGLDRLHPPKYVSNSGERMSIHRDGVWKIDVGMWFDEKNGRYIKDRKYGKDIVGRVSLTDSERQQFLSELDEFLTEIVAVQEEPKLNLQDWFNSIYEKQFNE